MKIVKKEYEVFTFDELSKKSKEKVLENLRDINVDYDGWADWIIEDKTAKLEKLGYKDITIYYSGFCSQGDGACFIAKVDIEEYIKAHKLGKKYRKLLSEVKAGNWANITIKHGAHYYYSRSTTVDYEGVCDLTDKAYSQLENLASEVEAEREEVGDEIYDVLKANYFELTDNTSIIDTIEANEYTFLEDGEMFNE